jgi:hypothetical protein
MCNESSNVSPSDDKTQKKRSTNDIKNHALLSVSLVAGTIAIAAGLYYFGANPIADRWSRPLEESLQHNVNTLDSNLNIYLKNYPEIAPAKKTISTQLKLQKNNYYYKWLSLIVPISLGATIVSETGISIDNNYVNKYPEITPEKQRIREQIEIILTKKRQNKNIATDYYKWIFVVLPITSGAAIVSGISLFFISKEGWNQANSYIITVFITASTIALLVGSLSVIFKMQENAGRHIESFVAYENLYQQILTRLATISTTPVRGSPADASPSVSQQLQTLITDTNALLLTYNKILINFDSSSIQMPSFLLNNSSSENGGIGKPSGSGQ